MTNRLRCDIITFVADSVTKFGGLAQLGEHLPYKQRVTGSSPVVPTKKELAYASSFFIQAAGLAYHHDAVVYIIKGGKPPLYLITRQRVSTCGLMIYNTSC